MCHQIFGPLDLIFWWNNIDFADVPNSEDELKQRRERQRVRRRESSQTGSLGMAIDCVNIYSLWWLFKRGVFYIQIRIPLRYHTQLFLHPHLSLCIQFIALAFPPVCASIKPFASLSFQTSFSNSTFHSRIKAVQSPLQTICTSPHLNLPHSPHHDLCTSFLANFKTVWSKLLCWNSPVKISSHTITAWFSVAERSSWSLHQTFKLSNISISLPLFEHLLLDSVSSTYVYDHPADHIWYFYKLESNFLIHSLLIKPSLFAASPAELLSLRKLNWNLIFHLHSLDLLVILPLILSNKFSISSHIPNDIQSISSKCNIHLPPSRSPSWQRLSTPLQFNWRRESKHSSPISWIHISRQWNWYCK